MFDFWLADENVIFAASGLLLAGLALLQISGITDLDPYSTPFAQHDWRRKLFGKERCAARAGPPVQAA